ncbi:MAG: DinB family protein [Spirochaetales bacterium]|nr:DinB family protein [Spirochaetales bacterium]
MEEILKNLCSSPDMLALLIDEIPAGRLYRRYKNADWCIHDHLKHLLETQDIFTQRIELFRDNESPEIPAFFPGASDNKEDETQEAKDVPALLDEFKTIRTKQIELIRNLSGEVSQRQAVHSEHSVPLSFKRLLLHFLSHDYYHIYRIEELGTFKEENIKAW